MVRVSVIMPFLIFFCFCLLQAQELLRRIETRNLYKLVGQTILKVKLDRVSDFLNLRQTYVRLNIENALGTLFFSTGLYFHSCYTVLRESSIP